MLPLYKTRFRVEPVGCTLAEMAGDCVGFIDGWVRRSFEKSGRVSEGVLRVDDFDRQSDVPQLRSNELESGAFLHSFFWAKPDSDERSRWVSLIDLVSDGEIADFQLQLGIEADSVQLEATKRETGPPRLIATLLSHPRWTCRSGDQKLSIQALEVTAHEVESLCNEVLFSPRRDLPVVVVTPDTRGRRFPVRPWVLAHRLGGTAKTIQLRDALAVQVLDDFLGRALSIGPDAIRVLAPGVEPGVDMEGQWHFLGETIRRKRLSDHSFSNFLFGRLAARGLVRFRDSPLISRFRSLADQERARKLEGLRDERELYDEYTRALEDQNRQLQASQKDLEARVQQLQQQSEQLQADLHAALQNIRELSVGLGRPEVEMAEAPIGPETPRTVSEIVADAAEYLPDLLILDSARKSADDVPVTYKFSDRVVKALQALQQGAAHRRETGRVGQGWKAFFAKTGFEYKLLSEKTKNTWGNEYTFLCQGEPELFEEHFTIGVKDRNTCLSIHFSTRLRDDKIVVGYVGEHLRNTQT